MKSVAEMTQGELAAFIDSHLRKKDINVVLSGGATVSVYSDNKYVSKDLDFISRYSKDEPAITSAMTEIGFEQRGKYYFHTQTPYFVEFISGPPSVGDEPIRDIQEIEMATGVLRIISPTDSVKDRLAAFYYWEDRQGLEQAILVAEANPVDMEDLKSWSEKEGKLTEFEEFSKRLRQ
jgi:hypothetical protein